jgi:methionyl-tRNA synthetase
MSSVITKIGERMNKVTATTQKVTDDMNRLKTSNDLNKPRKLQQLLGKLAVTQQEYAVFLKESNDKMEDSLSRTFTSLEFVITFKSPSTDEEQTALTNMLSQLTSLENNSQESLSSFTNLAKTMKELPKMERNLNKAIDDVVIQLERFIGYTQQVVAMSSKSISIAKKLLGD